MSTGVIYLLTRATHAVRLVVSLGSLRRYYDGPVTLFVAQEGSRSIGEAIQRDERLDVDVQDFQEIDAGENSAIATKPCLPASSPYDVAAFFDADTLIVGDISAILAAAAAESFCTTQFADWLTTHDSIRYRLSQWSEVKQKLADDTHTASLLRTAGTPYAAINSGVFAFRRDASILGPWRELTMIGKNKFLCDEVALQLVLRRHAHAVLDCRYNCSPVHAAATGDVRVWHFHGGRHVEKPIGWTQWLPVYRECVEQNLAQIRDWQPAGDKPLLPFL